MKLQGGGALQFVNSISKNISLNTEHSLKNTREIIHFKKSFYKYPSIELLLFGRLVTLSKLFKDLKVLSLNNCLLFNCLRAPNMTLD